MDQASNPFFAFLVNSRRGFAAVI